jgi:hypothetical protein
MKETLNCFNHKLALHIVMMIFFTQGIKGQYDPEKSFWMGYPPYPTEKINMFISLDTTQQALEYNELKTRLDRDNIVQSRINPDWVSTMAEWQRTAYPDGVPVELQTWACGPTSMQLMTNSHIWGENIYDDEQWNPPRLLYGGYSGFNLDTILMNQGTFKDMGKLGLPLYLVVIGEINGDTTGGHAMNVVLTGDDITKWENWNFVEPQFDMINLQPGGAYLPRNCGKFFIVYYYIRTLVDGKKQIKGIPIVQWRISDGIPILVKFNPYINDLLIIKRESDPPIINLNQSSDPDSLVWNIAEANFKSAWFSVNGAAKIPIGQNGAIKLGLPLGNSTVEIGADDYFRLHSETTIQRLRENSPPIISITSPLEDIGYDKNIIKLVYNITDTDFISACYSINGGPKITIGQSGIITLILGRGVNNIKIEATDAAPQTVNQSVSFEIMSTTDIELPTSDSKVSAYPNPTTAIVTLTYPSKEARIRILDLQGVLHETIIDNDRDGKTELNLTGYPSGKYIYKIEFEDYTYSGKIIKE